MEEVSTQGGGYFLDFAFFLGSALGLGAGFSTGTGASRPLTQPEAGVAGPSLSYATPAATSLALRLSLTS